MRPKLLMQTLTNLYELKRTVCIEGPPGGGKTTIVHELAESLNVPVVERHMPTMLVEDFGVLFPEGADRLRYRLPEWFPIKGQAPDNGILLFDDRNQASHDLQKVLANICQARTLHGVSMPDGWMVVSTGNRQQDRAGANRILSHLRNRETVLEFETNLDDWTAWALDHDVRPEVVSFIRFRPNLLHDFDAQREQNATPRSWVDGVSKILGTVPPEAEFECFKGAVGEAAAAEFAGFLRIFRTLPSPDGILLNASTAEVPTDPTVLYALCGALAYRSSKTSFNRICTYAERMPPEFSVLLISQIVRKEPKLAQTNEFAKWSVAHQSVLF